MRVINITVGDEGAFVSPKIVGRVGENKTTRLEFSLPPSFMGYQYYITFKPEGLDSIHTDTLEEEDGIVSYELEHFLLVKGVLQIELSAFEDDKVLKSAIICLEVPEGLDVGGEFPSDPYTPAWYVKVLDEANRAKDEADRAENSAILAETAKNETETAKSAAQTALQRLEEGIANGDFKGDPGEKGVPGQDGVDGKDGLNGQDGINGTNGADGLNGQDGLNGTDGVDGKSAYEVAVTNGFVGTQVQWLASLHGADGINATTTAVATETTNGLMSSTDKVYLDGLPVSMSAKADKDNLITAFTFSPSQATLPNLPSSDGSVFITCTAHGLSVNDIISFTGATPLFGGVAIPVGKKYRVIAVTGPNTFVPFGSNITAKAAGGWNVVKHSSVPAIIFSNLGVDSSCNEVTVEFKATTVYRDSGSVAQFYFTLNGITSASYCPFKSSAIGVAGALVSKFVISDCTSGENQGEEIHLCSMTLKRISTSVWSVLINSGYRNSYFATAYGYVSDSSFSTLSSLELLFNVGACVDGTFIIRRG
ncbi:MAG: hypothetical protein WCQ41_09140 [Bacillota bacterium]